MKTPNFSSEPMRLGPAWSACGWRAWVLAGCALAIIVGVYGFVGLFERARDASTFRWLWNNWNDVRGDYEHGLLIPGVTAFLLWRDRRKILEARYAPSLLGLAAVVCGIVFFLLSVRTLQPRVAAVSLPVVLVASSYFIGGRELARLTFFPCFILLFAIPIPGLTQATNVLQIYATKGAYALVSAVGIDVLLSGNNLYSTTDAWGFNVAEGCSGIRSLMALTLIAAVYAYITQKTLFKRLLLFATSIPLAIIANTLRVSSVVFVAEWFDPEFAGDLYHDYSGFLFFPFGLAGLVLCGAMLNSSFRAIERRTVIRRGEHEKSQNLTGTA